MTGADDRPCAAPRPPTGAAARQRRPKTRPQRETPPAGLLLLVAVIALSAIGILMVFSSSAMTAFTRDGDVFEAVGPQVAWGVARPARDAGDDERRLPLAAAHLGARCSRRARPAGARVRAEPFGQVVGGSARWLQIGPLPAVHPAEFAKLALVIYLAHWLAKRGSGIRGLLSGTDPVPRHLPAGRRARPQEPDLGTTVVLAVTGLTMFFVAGANLVHFGVLVRERAHRGRAVRAARLPARADPGLHRPVGRPAGHRLPHGPGAAGARLGRAHRARPGPEPRRRRAVPAERQQRLHLRDHRRGVRARRRRRSSSACSWSWPTRASGSRWRAPDTFGALLAAGITAWLCVQAFINIGVVVALLPITGITLPFISAGGSSLAISFAAVGILLSISRETVERGTWNDASADRGRRHGRAHLPGSGRRPVAARQRP